jgi:LuxR family transcriptional regulator, quorum-sensing system regulator BjaR1
VARVREVFDGAVDAINSLDELGARFERAIRRFGLTHFAIGTLPRPDRESRLWLTNWPASWVERYALNGYAAEDIAVHEALRSPEPRSWDELKARYPGQGQRILAAAADYGWRDGFIVPVHDPDGEKGLVATMGPELAFAGPESRATTVALALATFEKARTLYRQKPDPSPLTRREREALQLVARGLDDQGIARALGVTRSSAHAYVERAKKRLGAATRAQAVALALAHGLIHPVGEPAGPNRLSLNRDETF